MSILSQPNAIPKHVRKEVRSIVSDTGASPSSNPGTRERSAATRSERGNEAMRQRPLAPTGAVAAVSHSICPLLAVIRAAFVAPSMKVCKRSRNLRPRRCAPRKESRAPAQHLVTLSDLRLMTRAERATSRGSKRPACAIWPLCHSAALNPLKSHGGL